jgi:hypothetical protein
MKDSGKTISEAPAAAASATDCTARAMVALRSSSTGGRWMMATLVMAFSIGDWLSKASACAW